jgi:hypothetical protein
MIIMVEWRCPSPTRSGENPCLGILRMIPDHILFERKRYLGRERVVIIEKGVL